MEEYTLRELANRTHSELIGNPDQVITGVENLDAASSCEAAFLDNPLYANQLVNSNAGVIIVSPKMTLSQNQNYLIHKNPSLAFQTLIELFIHPISSGFENIHPSAVIHKSATLGENVVISPHVVIDKEACIGANTFIGPGVTIGPRVTIGANCHLHAHVVIRERCSLGKRVVIQPGAVIGSCGFGYFTDSKGKHCSLRHLGTVKIEDDVEIGANTTIDRARFKETVIKQGTKIDNLVQIAHQVELGEDNLIVSQVGIAGSTKTGRNVVMGGQVGVAGHISIADGVMLAARAAVSKSLLEPGAYSGMPAAPVKEFNLQFVQMRSVGKFIKRLKSLESRVEELNLTRKT